MSSLNIFIDGSWLFKACGRDGVLSNQTDYPDSSFRIDFSKLITLIGKHVRTRTDKKIRKGDFYMITSIFDIPDNFNEWPDKYQNITAEHVNSLKMNISTREKFVEKAINAGFKEGEDFIYRVNMKPYMVNKVIEGKYQEKQVDSTVVALLVKYAITRPSDYHVVVSGDADMIPAIKIAYPEFTSNVTFATIHPDQYDHRRNNSSVRISDLELDISPVYLDACVDSILQGDFVYKCSNSSCKNGRPVFVSNFEIPKNKLPYCRDCRGNRFA
jgi:uncharacterized LabA/DUF88 family protein